MNIMNPDFYIISVVVVLGEKTIIQENKKKPR